VILHIDPASPVPPYEQLRAQVSAMVRIGELGRGTRLPSIRQLANDLDLAGGTVARAYRELERDGVVETRGRHGTVGVGRDGPPYGQQTRLRRAAATFAAAARQLGAGDEEAVTALRSALEELDAKEVR
jgi:GntR family transcriptional regulator